MRFKRNASGRGRYLKGDRLSIAYRGFTIRRFIRLTPIRMGATRLYTLGPLAVFIHGSKRS